VSARGKVTALAAGGAVIIAISDDGGYTAVCAVTVTPKPIKVTGITLSQTSLTLAAGGQAALTYTINPSNATNQSVTWKSSNAGVVTVENGRLTAIKKGKATITVTTADGVKSARCAVVVS
jgi:uncharacterized protein YjdB